MTKLCIPTQGGGGMNDTVGEHFGRVPTFTLIDADTEAVQVLDNTSEHRGGAGLPADLLAQAGVNVVLCQGLGRRAIQILSDNGIAVHTGVSGTVSAVLAEYKRGTHGEAGSVEPCTRHEYHDQHE